MTQILVKTKSIVKGLQLLFVMLICSSPRFIQRLIFVK